MKICRQGMPFHHLPKYQNPTTLCLSSMCSYPSCFFQSVCVAFIYNMGSVQTSPEVNRKVHYGCDSISNRLYFPQPSPAHIPAMPWKALLWKSIQWCKWCYGIFFYESFSLLAYLQLLETQHHFKLCMAWVAQFHSDFILGKVCHTQTVLPSVNLVSFTSNAYKRVAGIHDVFT